jgi:hypothetical protein
MKECVEMSQRVGGVATGPIVLARFGSQGFKKGSGVRLSHFFTKTSIFLNISRKTTRKLRGDIPILHWLLYRQVMLVAKLGVGLEEVFYTSMAGNVCSAPTS